MSSHTDYPDGRYILDKDGNAQPPPEGVNPYDPGSQPDEYGAWENGMTLEEYAAEAGERIGSMEGIQSFTDPVAAAQYLAAINTNLDAAIAALPPDAEDEAEEVPTPDTAITAGARRIR